MNFLHVVILLGSFMPAIAGHTQSAAAGVRYGPEVVDLGDGQSALPLNGPWHFHTGDSSAWAEPPYDDSGWDIVSLTPNVGSHDPDVGLTGYVPGWQARGHRGYTGYAWYRIRILIRNRDVDRLSLLGPVLVDSAYQLYVNGELLGGVGDFSRLEPVVYGIHPRIFAIPDKLAQWSPQEKGVPIVVAVRVWMEPRLQADPTAGGIHIAPVIGNDEGIRSAYQVQWLQRIRGEIPEIEAIFFIALAVMAFFLAPLGRGTLSLRWLGVALLLTALVRSNLVVFWCSGFESVQLFEAISIVFLIPVTLASWIMTWYYWFGLRIAWMPYCLLTLTAAYCISEAFMRSWAIGVVPSWLTSAARSVVAWDRYALLTLLVLIVVCAMAWRPAALWLPLPVIILTSIALFSSELYAHGVPGIWFPYGTGVSLSNCVYVISTPFISLLLWYCLRSNYAERDHVKSLAPLTRS